MYPLNAGRDGQRKKPDGPKAIPPPKIVMTKMWSDQRYMRSSEDMLRKRNDWHFSNVSMKHILVSNPFVLEIT